MAERNLLEKIFIFSCNYFLNIIYLMLIRPFAYLVDQYYIMKVWYSFHYKKQDAQERHDRKVLKVQNQVLDWIKAGRKNKLCTARPGWQTMSLKIPKYKKTLTGIKINMGEIYDLDEEREIIKVEPMVTMGQISSVLAPLGWTLQVFPELNELTIGGLINGAGLETSSHKYGTFHDICESYEVVLPNGEIANCSKECDPELFYGTQLSHGTIGFLVCAEIKIMRAKKYVKLDYIPVNSLEDARDTFEREVSEAAGNEFVEGIMYDLNSGVIMTGNFADSIPPGKHVNHIGRYYKPWFYKHAETFLKKGKGTDYIPLQDYYHRHTRSSFWLSWFILPLGNTVLFRYLFGWILPIKLSFLKLVTAKWIKDNYEKNQVLQDYVVSFEKFKELMYLSERITKIYPIWMCGVNAFPKPGFGENLKATELYIDVGIYGDSTLPNFDPVKAVKIFEKFALKINGYQGLYADCYHTREEFRQMFHHGLYDKVRERFECDKAFPEVYDKVNISARY